MQRGSGHSKKITIDNTQTLVIEGDPNRTILGIDQADFPVSDVEVCVGEHGEFITLARQDGGITQVIPPFQSPVLTSKLALQHNELSAKTFNVLITNPANISVVPKV
jgi:hypothetical protein